MTGADRGRRVAVFSTRVQDVPGAPAWLEADDRRRLEALRRPADRAGLLVSRSLLRHAVARTTGIAPAEQRFVRRCVVCGGPHGRPRLVPPGLDPQRLPASATVPHISLSHAGGLVLVALHPTAPVGVDVESVAATRFDGFEDVALTPAERTELARLPPGRRDGARATWWVRKEAVLKATGHGLAVDPTYLRVSGPDGAPRLIDWTHPTLERPRVGLRDVPTDEEHAAAVAVIDVEDPRVELRQVSPDELATS